MFHSSVVAGRWPDLVHRLDTAGAVARWAAVEPALTGFDSVAALPGALRAGSDPTRADQVLGALVRWAAADGGDDPDAVLVLVHLLSDGAAALARKLAHCTEHPMEMVVGELTCQIRLYPWRRRTRAYAAGLLLDTKHALWRGELRPPGDGRTPREAHPVDPTRWAELTGQDRAGQTAVDGDPTDVELLDLLAWAAARGVATIEDLRLLLELERCRGYGRAAGKQVAAAFGISEKTVRRRRDRTLGALRAGTDAYLAEVA
jgi:hypothetical protein